ncbi:hypothetical protein JCM3765_005068 [Sporobolomyces pararoseus]
MSLSSPPSPSFISTSPQLLYAISSTLLITLFVLPIYFAPQFARSFRSQAVNNRQKATIGIALASTGTLVLYGVCGLIALGHGSLDAAISAGILGTLSLLLIDVQAIVSVLWVEKVGSWKKISVFTGISSSVLMLSTIFQIILLSLDNPSKGTLFALSHARGIFHLAFDLTIVGILARRLHQTTGQASTGQDIESQQAGESSMIGLSEVKLNSNASPSISRVTNAAPLEFQHHRQARLMFLQLLSTLLSVLSLSFPILPNYLPIDPLGTRFISPSIFGTTTASSASIVLSLVVVVKWSGTLFELAAQPAPTRTEDVETGPRPIAMLTETRALVSIPLSFAPTSRPSTGNSLVHGSEGSSTLNTFDTTFDRPLNNRSRSHSVSSLLSLGANVPPRISEECERSQQDQEEEDQGSCALTDSSEDYFHSETFPAPFVEAELEGGKGRVETRRFSRRCENRPRSVSSPEPFCSRPISPRTPSPVATRTRKDAGRLSRPAFDRSFSSTSIVSKTSPTLSRPTLNVDVTADDTYHSAISYTPARSSQQAESGRSTPSPTKSRRPSLRSLVGISTPRLPSSGESPTNYRGGKRRGSRSSSISFLRGNLNQDEAVVTPTLEIETDEDDPFATIQASQAIEATKKVEEWARRKASEKEMLSTEGGFEEDIEIVSPIRQSFERLGSPVRITTSALAHLSDPSLHPRRSPSSSNSLFHEHLFSLEDSRNIKLTESRSRSGSLGSAITLGSKANTLENESTAMPYRFGKSFSSSPSLSPTPTSTKLLGAIGICSILNQPPRSDSFSTRPLSSQVEKKEESPEQIRTRTRSSAPPPSSADISPRISPVRRIFSRRLSATGKLFSSSPPTINYPSPAQTRKGSRASSTFSTASFSLSKLRRGSSSGMLRPSLAKLTGGKGGGGGSGIASQVSTASFRRSASSDLSFMCRGEGGSSYQSSLRHSLARSASLDFQIGSSSHSSSVSVKAEEVDEKSQVEIVASPSSPPRTTNWWTQGDFDARPLTPYRSSPRRSRKARSRTTSAPASISPKKRQPVDPDSTEEEEENDQDEDSKQNRHARSQSLPFNRLSDYQLKAPKRISPIGSLFISPTDDKEEDLTPSAQRTSQSTSLLLGLPPLILSQPSSKSTSARSSLSLTLSHLQDFTTRSKDKTISDGDLEELTALCKTFTPVEDSDSLSSPTYAAIEADPISPQVLSPSSLISPLTPSLTTSSFSPATFATISSWPGAELSTSPTFSQISPLSCSTPSSSAISHSSIDYGISRISLESEPKGSMVDYWLRDRSQWVQDDEQECLEGTGEGEQMF